MSIINSIIAILSNAFKSGVISENKSKVGSGDVSVNAISKKEIVKIGLSESDFHRAAAALDCDIEVIKAFARVESRGSGFLPDGRPVILFERHIFNRLLKAKGVSCDDTSICSSRVGGYLGGSREHDRLNKAIAVDRESALQSASWGMFQCMGFNWKVCGYDSLQDFINAAYRSESDHLNMFVGFIKANKTLADAVRNKNWDIAARMYNGPGYKKNEYDVKLAQAYSEEITRNLV